MKMMEQANKKKKKKLDGAALVRINLHFTELEFWIFLPFTAFM